VQSALADLHVYLSHLLTSVQNFTEIDPGGVQRKKGTQLPISRSGIAAVAELLVTSDARS